MNLKNTFKITVSAFALTFLFGNQALAQVGIGTTNPDKSAALEVKATDKGFLAPRLTLSQRNSIVRPAEGLLIFQTDNNPGLYYYTSGKWQAVVDNMGNHMATENIKLNGNWISNNGTDTGLRLSNDGRAGIGVEKPTARLDVDGDVKFKGPLLPNGEAGEPGQVLVSNGPGNAPEWKEIPSPMTVIYNNLVTDISSQGITISKAPKNQVIYDSIPGLSRTINLQKASKVIINCDGGLFTYGTKANDFSVVDIAVMVNGSPLSVGGYRRVIAHNNAHLPKGASSWSVNTTISLPPGTHHISVRARLVDGDNAEIAGDDKPMQAILQTLVIGE